MKLNVQLEGGEELQRKLSGLAGELRGRVLDAALTSGANLIANDAKQRAPYLTGTLRRSIHVGTPVAGLNERSVAVGTDLEYAARIEFGFAGMDSRGRRYNQAAQPYLRPALDGSRSAVEREVTGALRALLGAA